MEEIELPCEKVDIIVSEWMVMIFNILLFILTLVFHFQGYFLLFEGMFDSVIHARDKWLAPGGSLGPSHTNIVLAAIEDEEWINDKFHFWNDVYGFKMDVMKEGFYDEGRVIIVPESTLISNQVTIMVRISFIIGSSSFEKQTKKKKTI